MVERKIKLSDTEELKEFVQAAGQCDFDIDASYERVVVDAKSFLGMMYLGISKEMTIRYGKTDSRFENVIKKYAVC